MNPLPDHEDIWVAAKLAALREMRGMTQAELAERCGLKPAAIGLFEQGRRRPCLRNLLKLCEGLRCTPNDILLHNVKCGGTAAQDSKSEANEGAYPPLPLTTC